MDKVFIEYKVYPEKREQYLRFIKEMTEREPRMEVYEGTDQAGLFVEVWNGLDSGEYARLKQARTNEPSSEWAALHEFVPGGAEKIHIWHFTRIQAE
jgi:hypothetical protein